nr:chromosome partitioning protein ParB [Micromonospora sp. DSM 115978]
MTPRPRGRGKGLGALIPSANERDGSDSGGAGGANGEGGGFGPAPVAGAYFREISVDSVTPNPKQPRSHFDEDALEELAHSLREV